MSPNGPDDWVEYKLRVLEALQDYKADIRELRRDVDGGRLDAANAKAEILAKVESVRSEIRADLESVRVEAAKLSVKSKLAWALIGSLPAVLAAAAMWLSK